MEPLIQIDVGKLEQFLKQHAQGEDVVKALRYRMMVHWLHPDLDRLSARMLPVYEALIGHLEWPFSLLDVGCMCGWLKHFIARRAGGHMPFKYVGIDRWPEALKVAKEFDPYIEVHECDVLNEDIPGPNGPHFQKEYTYTWCSNIQFGDDAPKVVEKMMNVTKKYAFFGMPHYCGDYEKIAKDLGLNAETYNCGEIHNSHQYLVKVWR